MTRANKPKTIIIHHTAVKSDKPQFNAVNNYHKKLDFPLSSLGYYVGYHWFIERGGTVIRARADKDEGAHTLGGWNKKSIGICMAGDFSLETPSEAQIASLRSLMNDYNLPYLLHREADKRRTCPQFSREELILWLQNTTDKEDLEKQKQINKELKGVIATLIQWISKYFQVKR